MQTSGFLLQGLAIFTDEVHGLNMSIECKRQAMRMKALQENVCCPNNLNAALLAFFPSEVETQQTMGHLKYANLKSCFCVWAFTFTEILTNVQ